jgi:hypothetical protein
MPYTPTSRDIWRVRTLIRDACTPYLLSDREIIAFLDMGGFSHTASAALAAEAIARDNAKLKLIMEAEGFKTQREASKAYIDLADSIRTAKNKSMTAVIGVMTAGREYEERR